MEVKVSTAGRPGKLSKSVNVSTDDPVHANLSLTVEANIVVDVDLEATTLQLPQLKVGETHTQDVRVVAQDPAALAFGDVSCDLKGVTAKLVRRGTAAEPEWFLQLHAAPAAVGTSWGRVTVKVTAPVQRDLSLPVFLTVTGDIRVEPPQLNLVVPAGGGAVSASATIQSGKESFKILKAGESSGTGMVTVKVETVKLGKEYRVVVTRPAAEGAALASFTKVVVTTSSKQAPVLEIPVNIGPAAPAPALRSVGGLPPIGVKRPPVLLKEQQAPAKP